MKTHFFPADVVRFIAIFFVIGIHLVIPISSRPDFFGGFFWWITFLFNSLFRSGVPLFIILSGYLNLGKPHSIQQNLQRVTQRLVLPLVAYYAIFNIIGARIAWLRAEPFSYWDVFHNLSKNTNTVLYFLVVLVFIQLLNPLWNLLTEEKNLPVLQYVTKFFFALGTVAYLFYYLSLREGEVFSTFTLWIMWVGFYLYGYVVKLRPSLLTKKEVSSYSAMFFIGYLLTVGMGYLTLWLHYNHLSDLLYIKGQSYSDAYLSVGAILMSISSFNLLIRTRFVQKLELLDPVKKIITYGAALSFGLYLNHLLVIDVLDKFWGVNADSPSMPNLPSYVVINTLLTLVFTIAIVSILRKTPYLKTIIGEK